ncbi:MAG: ModD protein [Deferribacterales bacterium]
MFFSENTVDQWIEEDVPGFDLTTGLLTFDKKSLNIKFSARHDMTLSAAEAAVRVLTKAGCVVKSSMESGTAVKQGDLIIEADGAPKCVHTGWRIALNLLEYCSGIATRTNGLVKKARAVNENIVVCGTRKSFPGTRRLSQQALLSGGGISHRLGLAETVLFFAAHYDMAGGLDKLFADLPKIRLNCIEKKIGIELEDLKEIEKAAKAGIDTIQTDKMTPDQVKDAVKLVKNINPNIKVAAAGGINIDNCAEYAASGCDMLVTSWMYFGKPADVKASIS